MRLALNVVLLAAFLCGCRALNPPPTIATVGGHEAGRRIDRAPQPERIAALSSEIQALSPAISADEAAHCADRAVRYTALLARHHHLTGSAEFNSLLVNIGIHRRGQCFQLADDLNAELAEQHYQTLIFTRAITDRGKPLSEHNVIVITAPGQPFDDGLVIDPWRNPGVLRWARVKLDDYKWVPRMVGPPVPSPSTRACDELSRVGEGTDGGDPVVATPASPFAQRQ